MAARVPILVFDGDCAFCTSSAALLRRVVDRRNRYAVEAWQRLDLAALGLTPEECDRAVQFVDAAGGVHSGHRAIARALASGAPGWRPIGRLLVVPGVDGLAARVYRWVAEHRHVLPGGTPACALPSGPSAQSGSGSTSKPRRMADPSQSSG